MIGDLAIEKLYCLCGAHLSILGPEDVVKMATDAFRCRHQGQGHGPCDVDTCVANRNLAERKTLQGKGK